MSDNQDFDKIIGEEFDTAMADQVSALMAKVGELQKRISFYEGNAQAGRHAVRALRKATTPQDANEALEAIRAHLRAIHPTTEIDGK